MKQIIGKSNDKSNFPRTFNINDNTTSDQSKIAQEFNEYFAMIGKQTSQNVSKTNKHFNDYLEHPNVNSMFLEQIDTSIVFNTTMKLKPKLSCGQDEISSKLLKQTINEIIQPLTHIINRSFDTGIVPNKLKIAKVMPVFKNSDKTVLKKLQICQSSIVFFKNIGKNNV